jgi:predicted amidohydrolase YtcJ
MKSYFLILASVFMLFSCTESSQKPTVTETNQTIYYGGDIITMQGNQPQYVEAVVSDHDKIVFIGAKAEALRQYANATPYDLEGKTMMPAFIDPHSHFMSAIRMVQQVNVASPPMGSATSISEIMNLLNEFKTQNNIKDGDWIVGWGYDQDLLAEKRHITKTDIDAFFPNNKVLIVHVSMHGAILNSKALEWAEIDENTQTPDGGVIARMPNSNEPAGLLMEMAYLPVFANMPQPSVLEMLELVKPAQLMYASNGYSQAVEGFSHITDMDFLQTAASQGKLFLDIISLPGFTEMDKWLNNSKYPFGTYNNHLKFGGGKFTLDGSPQGKTAYMAYPYLTGGPNGEQNWYGSTSIPKEELAELAKKMVDNNIQINFHANGGGAINDAVYAIEHAGITAKMDKRPIIIHSQFQDTNQLKKYVELGITPTYFTNHTFFWGDVHIKNVGLENASFISPINTARSLGIVTSNHTDFNVTPLDPFFVIWTATNRITRSGNVLGSDERINSYQALQDLTTGPAWQFFEENRKGKIQVGMLADFVILENNPIKQNVSELRTNMILETIKEGSSIYKKTLSQ